MRSTDCSFCSRSINRLIIVKEFPQPLTNMIECLTDPAYAIPPSPTQGKVTQLS